MGSGTDVAIAASDITLISGNLAGVPAANELSCAEMANIRQNLVFAFVYNVAGISITAGLVFPLTGRLLSPMIAGAAMAFSSVSVVSNAPRLRRFSRPCRELPPDDPSLRCRPAPCRTPMAHNRAADGAEGPGRQPRCGADRLVTVVVPRPAWRGRGGPRRRGGLAGDHHQTVRGQYPL